MNPIQEQIRQRLASFPDELAPLVDLCHRYLKYCCVIDTDDTLMIAHQPWEAPLKYAIVIFAPAKKAWFPKYTKMRRVEIPSGYRRILRSMNGLFAFGLSLYGMPASMLQGTPTLDRSRLQCQDIGSANSSWKSSYQVDDSKCYFGGRSYSKSENTGYFLDGQGAISAHLKDGTELGRWPDFTPFLAHELDEAEQQELAETPESWWH